MIFRRLQEVIIPEATIPRTPSRPRALAGLVAATVLLPLAILLLGLWEARRGADDLAEFAAERDRLARVVADLEARMPRDGRPDYRLQFRHGGQNYGGPYALVKAREARDEAGTLVTLMDWRRLLPPVAIAGGGIAAALSVLVLLAGALLGRLGRGSRNALVAGFSMVRRLLPATLAFQILAATAGFVAVVLFEVGLLVQGGLDSGSEIKLLGIAAVAVGATVFGAGGALFGLRRTLGAFEPEPLSILGRQVTEAEAPGLWRLIDRLAGRIGALRPEAVVVGLTGGFFVSAGSAVLEPGEARFAGRILYLPLPHLALMRIDETAAILAHELAHYAGGDTAYSQRFLPIYAGVGRSLDAVAAGHHGSLGLLGPSLRLGRFVMERFHLAVRHWSRAREFAADAAGAAATSTDASARALLRSGALGPRIAETLDAAAENPDAAPPDLVAAVLDRAVAHGLDDPAAHLEAEQAHPTDTHPPTRERVAALGRTLDADLLAAAATAPARDAPGPLAACFADPGSLCRTATADFLGAVRERDAAVRAHLETTAAEIGTGERVLRANYRSRGIVLAAAGALFAAAALTIAVFGVPGISPHEARVVLGVALILATIFGGFAALVLSRGEPVILVLSPEGLKAPALDRAISWDDIADFDVTTNAAGLSTRLLLPPEAALPQRDPRGRGVKLDARRRIVTIAHGLPRRMKPQAFADLIARYRMAAHARRMLAESGVARPARPEVDSA